jgi:hypothetical protein
LEEATVVVMMSVRQLIDRLAEVLAEDVGLQDLPFVVKRQLTAHRVEYVPVNSVGSGRVALDEEHGAHVVQGDCGGEILVFDAQTKVLRWEPIWPRK